MTTTYVQLDDVTPTLPSHYYYDEGHYRTEIHQIWLRQWLCVARVDAISNPGDYQVVEVGDQSVVLTRDKDSQLRAFHNTCRHRGSILCEHARGKFRGQRIVCPYHSWTYSLSGELIATPFRLEGGSFDNTQFSLYDVAVSEWGGFVFINLDENATPLGESTLADTPAKLANWNLGETVTAHTTEVDIACNWKVFWENFSECYHCPKVHPELCRIVPQFREGMATSNVVREPNDISSPLADGAVTWSVGGKTDLPWFEGLTEREQQQGQAFGIFHPSGYVVAHVDYARVVHLLPIGPEKTRLTVSWMVPPQTLEHVEFSLDKLIELGEVVVREDGHACELNQRGLRSNRHKTGVLVPQEIFVHEFHQWVRKQLMDTGKIDP